MTISRGNDLTTIHPYPQVARYAVSYPAAASTTTFSRAQYMEAFDMKRYASI